MDTKQNIAKKSEALFLKYGIKSVTMDDIARELGISKKTLYQHFESKTEIVEMMFDIHLVEERAAMEQIHGNSPDAIAEMLNVAKHVLQLLRRVTPTLLYDLNKYYKEAWQVSDRIHQAHIYNDIKCNMEWGVREGIYRLDISPDIIARLYVAKSSVIIDENVFPLNEFSLEELFNQLFIYHIRGIASPEGLALLDTYLKK